MIPLGMQAKKEPYELFDAERLIAFAQAMLKFAPVIDGEIDPVEGLRILKSDPDEVDTLYDLYVNSYQMYIQR